MISRRRNLNYLISQLEAEGVESGGTVGSGLACRAAGVVGGS